MVDRTPSAEDDPGHALLEVAPRLAHAMRHRLGRLQPSLTYRQYRVLQRIAEGTRSLTGLRTPATVSLSTLSEIVDSLVGRGFVERVPNQQDRRAVDLTLTSDGARVLRSARSALDDLAERLLADLPATPRRELRRALRSIDASVQALLGEEHEQGRRTEAGKSP